MEEEHDSLEIELCLKTDNLSISAATGFVDQTEWGNNVVLVKVCPLIDGVNPLPLIYVICSTFRESQAHQHLSVCCECHIYWSYKLISMLRNLSLCRLFPQHYLHYWTMELIFRLNYEARRKRPFLPIESNIQQHLLSIKMCAHLWSQINVVVVGLQRHTGSWAAYRTLPIMNDLLLKLPILLHGLALRTWLCPL